MATKEKEVASTDQFVVGEWVEAIKKAGDYIPKGTLLIVSSVEKSLMDSSVAVDVVFMTADGNTGNCLNVEIKKLTKIPAPQFVLAWSNKNQDPMVYCKSLEDANAFMLKLAKKRGENKVIEMGVFKRI